LCQYGNSGTGSPCKVKIIGEGTTTLVEADSVELSELVVVSCHHRQVLHDTGLIRQDPDICELLLADETDVDRCGGCEPKGTAIPRASLRHTF